MGNGHVLEDGGDPFALALNGLAGEYSQELMTKEERQAVQAAGQNFASTLKAEDRGPCLLIFGPFIKMESGSKRVEEEIKDACLQVFGYPPHPPPHRAINVLLDSIGGSLDTAFKMIRWLSWYADRLNVYVPRKAKSASTLLALGATRLYLSPFGELGPLDTKIEDPRNPTSYVSALDCYQSMDHVRRFGATTMNEALAKLSDFGKGQIPLADLVGTASEFSIGAVGPMLRGIRALDFGAWGRSLQIGEVYARILLLSNHTKEEADRIAERLVYRYTHHLFPIDYQEARDIGLDARVMDEATYASAMEVIGQCHRKAFMGFVSGDEVPGSGDEVPGSGDEVPGTGAQPEAEIPERLRAGNGQAARQAGTGDDRLTAGD